MLIPKFSTSEMCDRFDRYINGIYGKVNIAGDVMPTSEALQLMGDKYDELLAQYLEERDADFYEVVDITQPLGGRI